MSRTRHAVLGALGIATIASVPVTHAGDRAHRAPYDGGYAQPPYTYGDRDDYFLSGRDAEDADGFQPLHVTAGEVMKLDRKHGRLSLKTDDGIVELQFPASLLRNVEKGDWITIELGRAT